MTRRKHRGNRRALRAAVSLALAAWLAAPSPAPAWEPTGHRLIVNRAVDSLPYPLRAYFEANRNNLVQLAADPGQWGDEQPKAGDGFLHLDAYGRYPFAELPRDYNAAVRRYSRAKVARNGRLPWVVGVYSAKLEDAFREQEWDKVKLYAAVLAHYVAEAHDPFNTTVNSNGEQSGQAGVDARYSRSLVERYQGFFPIRPGGAFKIEDPTAHAFGLAIESNTWVDNILLADSQARAGKVDYNDEYYDAFFEGAGAVLIRQLTNASQNVGAYWYTAWLNAGRPALPAH